MIGIASVQTASEYEYEYRFAEYEYDEQPESSIADEGLDRSSLICARVNSSA